MQSKCKCGEDHDQMVNYEKLFNAITTISELAKIAKSHESDDFNFILIEQLNDAAQKALWHLTRGERGTPNRLSLTIYPSSIFGGTTSEANQTTHRALQRARR